MTPNQGMLDTETREEPKTLPLMGGIVRPEGMATADDAESANVGKGQGFLSQGTVLIIIVAILSAGGIYLLRISQGDVSVSSESKLFEAKIEQALVKLANPTALPSDDPLLERNIKSLFADTDSVVAMFSDDHASRQVPLEYVKKNPFASPSERKVVDAAGVTTVVDRSDQEKQRELKRLAQEFKQLKLDAVMQGRVPVAIINGAIVQPGQTVGSFTVKSISGLGAQLEAAGQIYNLAIEVKGER